MLNIFKKLINNQVKNIINPLLKEMEERVNFLQSMQKLEIKDGDIIVLRHPRYLKNANQLKEIVEEIMKNYSYNIHVMVLEEGMEIGVLTASQKNR
jgi:hypothetical protein